LSFAWLWRARHIEAFHAIYTSGSISTAARALNVSQPSLSKVLKHAEDQLGFPLFRRIKGRLVPTDEAHVLFREVADVQQRLASLRRTARNLRGGKGGHLRVAVLPSLGLGVAPEAISRFRKQHPDVTFEVMTLHHDEVPRALYERKCELAVAYDLAPHPQLKTDEIGTGEVVVLFRREEFPALPRRLDLGWLRNRDIVGLSASGPVGNLFASAVAQRELPIREVVSVQTFYLAAALARHGASIAVVDELTARASVAESGTTLDFRPLEPALRFSIAAAHFEDRPLSMLAKRFQHTLQAVLAETLES
jgi:DNA-binding transcriptional LysR family regulator